MKPLISKKNRGRKTYLRATTKLFMNKSVKGYIRIIDKSGNFAK